MTRPTDQVVRDVLPGLDLHRQDARTDVGVYEAGAVPSAHDPVGTFAGFPRQLQTGGGHELEAFLVSDVTVRSTY